MSENLKDNQPELPYLREIEAADEATLAELYAAYTPNSREDYSNSGNQAGNYWGLAIARACINAGVNLGIETDEQADTRVVGDRTAINYWLNVAGYELRIRGYLPETQSRSGIKTVLSAPDHSELFEHMYAVHTGKPIEEIMSLDPMFSGVRIEQPASVYELIDHEGFQALYHENPDHCIHLYLTRQLPHLSVLRKTIQTMEGFIGFDEEELRDRPGTIKRDGIIKTQDSRQRDIQFQRSRVEYWQTEYDFTLSLLNQGYKPYSLKDILPIAEGYVSSLIATNPDLNPAHLEAKIPDARKELNSLLTNMERRSNADQN